MKVEELEMYGKALEMPKDAQKKQIKIVFNRLKNGCAFIFLILLAMACGEESIVDVTMPSTLDEVMESEYKKYQLPGLAYASIRGDEILHSGALGFANVKEEIPLTTNTRMKIASVSKTMVATAIMQLYDDGVLQLDENVDEYLPFSVQNPHYKDSPITVNMLLTHTSSINDAFLHEFYLFGYVDYPESLSSFLESYLTKGGQYYSKGSYFKNKPGDKSIYSNYGTALLALIVEHMSGVDFNTYCKENIFEPLGMNRTTWFFSETPREELAIAYFDNNNRDPKKPFYTWPTYPDGGLMTTVEDLSKFMRAYLGGGSFDGYRLLEEETIDLMFTSQTVNDVDENQGLIFVNIKKGNIEVWGHDGGDPGVAAEFFMDMETGTGYIAIINRTMFSSYPTIGNALLRHARN